MSTATAPVRIGRTYTRARRYPWALGKVGDWTLPLGPYTPAQLTIAAGGVFVLVKTFSLWSPLGPLPVVGLGFLVWGVRATRMGGRSPLWVAYGWLQFALQPQAGRIGGHTVRPRRPHSMHGSLLVEETVRSAPATEEAAGPARAPKPRRNPRAPGTSTWRRNRRRSTTPPTAPAARPALTPLQQLLQEKREVQR
ncbi:hypothetical protein ACFQ7F_34660 [Streptomyces sp. NPDC056486]|uniref:hypothetical protein n=1 Tax=Streptomyces sp. NPDC056486 TaxID=3345835 RepID=UPI00368FECA8